MTLPKDVPNSEAVPSWRETWAEANYHAALVIPRLGGLPNRFETGDFRGQHHIKNGIFLFDFQPKIGKYPYSTIYLDHPIDGSGFDLGLVSLRVQTDETHRYGLKFGTLIYAEERTDKNEDYPLIRSVWSDDGKWKSTVLKLSETSGGEWTPASHLPQIPWGMSNMNSLLEMGLTDLTDVERYFEQNVPRTIDYDAKAREILDSSGLREFQTALQRPGNYT